MTVDRKKTENSTVASQVWEKHVKFGPALWGSAVIEDNIGNPLLVSL